MTKRCFSKYTESQLDKMIIVAMKKSGYPSKIIFEVIDEQIKKNWEWIDMMKKRIRQPNGEVSSNP